MAESATIVKYIAPTRRQATESDFEGDIDDFRESRTLPVMALAAWAGLAWQRAGRMPRRPRGRRRVPAAPEFEGVVQKNVMIPMPRRGTAGGRHFSAHP